MSPKAACVGMLDWGVGGLGVYRLLKQARPGLPILYCSDTGFTPYGKVPRAQLATRVQRVLLELVRRGASQLLVACNAASTVLPDLELPVPAFDVISAGVAAVPERLRGSLGIIGGGRTIRSGMYRRMLARPGLRVLSRVAQPLSGHIEAGRTGSAAFTADLRRILLPLRACDALLLACTHYPAIARELRAELSPSTRLIDPADELVRGFLRRTRVRAGAGQDVFLTTGSTAAMRRAAESAWGLRLPARCERLILT